MFLIHGNCYNVKEEPGKRPIFERGSGNLLSSNKLSEGILVSIKLLLPMLKCAVQIRTIPLTK